MRTIPLKNVTAPASPRVKDRFGTEVSQENRRLGGVTPRLLGSYPESPARLLPRSHALRSLAGATKRKLK